jgi:hypothetical protein
MYKKILVALENSRADDTLVPHIADLARRLGSPAVVIPAAGAVLSAAGAAHAQTATATGEELVVTGSRIARQDFTAISPVTTVGAQDIELTATLSVEQLINELPQVIPGNTVTSNNAGGEDFATVDLRGLGPNRTLILVNGRRLPAGVERAGLAKGDDLFRHGARGFRLDCAMCGRYGKPRSCCNREGDCMRSLVASKEMTMAATKSLLAVIAAAGLLVACSSDADNTANTAGAGAWPYTYNHGLAMTRDGRHLVAVATVAKASWAGLAPRRQLSQRSGQSIQQPAWRAYSAGMRNPWRAGETWRVTVMRGSSTKCVL